MAIQPHQQTVSSALTSPPVSAEQPEAGGIAESTVSLAETGPMPIAQATIGNAPLRVAANATQLPSIVSSQVSPIATPSPANASLQSQDPACEPTDSALYCIYTVQSGDNLGKIATKFGIKGNDEVTPWEILVQSNKPDIVGEDDLLQIGQQLRIPKFNNAVVHTVLRNQTLTDIADQFGVDTDDIRDGSGNDLSDVDNIRVGQELVILNPTRFTAPAPAVAAAAPTPASSGSASGSSASGSGGGSSGSGAAARTGPTSSAGLMWPVSGPISSYFGASHPLGIDIDLFSNPNAPVGAAASGTVTFAGGNACCSYGLYVIVDHGNGLQTLYAHFSQINVSVGQKVSAGQILGLGGRTGYATGNHLHFEVHVNGSIVNPMQYLP
jgi:murein DD-endopeptidase MepM/ murein hydrolase activator NlpD